MQLIDTHCHIHSLDYPLDAEAVYTHALQAGVAKLICVGTDYEDSQLAVAWANAHKNAWASVGVHPHEAKKGITGIKALLKNKTINSRVVAIGETGLDYHYQHSTKQQQIAAFESQLQLAQDYKLPVIFHVREAFEDFWPIVAQFKSLKGVLHSFTDSKAHLNKGLDMGFYVGVNGIATFTKDKNQVGMYKNVPLERLMLETDAPYLTPSPWRGKVNEPAYVREVAEHLAIIKSIRTPVSVEAIISSSTRNANDLFHF